MSPAPKLAPTRKRCRLLLIDRGALDPRLLGEELTTAASLYGQELEIERVGSALEARTRGALDEIDVVLCDSLAAQRLEALGRTASEVAIVVLERPTGDSVPPAANGTAIADRLHCDRIDARDLARAICFAYLRRRNSCGGSAAELRTQPYNDELTGVRNRQYLQEIVCNSELTDWGCILIALEGLRSIDEVTGYHRSKEILRGMADFLRGHVRENDVVVRSGDDEFLLLLPGEDTASTPALADRLHHAMVYAPCAFSLGMAMRVSGESVQQTLERAALQLHSSAAA